jgi:general secretion pathway protein L
VTLVLQTAVLHLRLSIPAAAFQRLPSILAFEAAAAWPLADDPPVWGWEIDHEASSIAVISVRLTMVRQSVVDAALDAAAAEGLRVVRAEAHAGGETETRDRAQVLGLNAPQVPSPRPRLWRGAVGPALAVCLFAGWLGHDLATEWQSREAASAELAAARAAAAPALSARRSLLAETDAMAEFRARLAAEGYAAAAIEALATALPEDAWLTEMALQGPSIRISGRASAAATVLSALETAPAFAEARFAAPVIRDAARGEDRFEIELTRRLASADEDARP